MNGPLGFDADKDRRERTNMPWGLDTKGLPISVMIQRLPFGEALILRGADAY